MLCSCSLETKLDFDPDSDLQHWQQVAPWHVNVATASKNFRDNCQFSGSVRRISKDLANP